jgi:hypothetical protein
VLPELVPQVRLHQRSLAQNLLGLSLSELPLVRPEESPAERLDASR